MQEIFMTRYPLEYCDLLQVDVWKDSLIPGEEVHIHLGPDAIKDFKAYLTERSLEFDTMIEDTQALIDNEEVCCSEVNEDNFDKCYHTLDEVRAEL